MILLGSSFGVLSTSNGFNPNFARSLLVSSIDNEACDAPPLAGDGLRCLEISGGGGVEGCDNFDIFGGGGALTISTRNDKKKKILYYCNI